jgi:hypothetical protein
MGVLPNLNRIQAGGNKSGDGIEQHISVMNILSLTIDYQHF